VMVLLPDEATVPIPWLILIVVASVEDQVRVVLCPDVMEEVEREIVAVGNGGGGGGGLTTTLLTVTLTGEEVV
jgi:hypothetical protein